ncbi:sulfite exporter TauE/SafE family protein [Fulvivirgaceae bacterium BMA12]|uniref:Probable membrane transporter protein n=1 Tax=Agaribacillus aureus TaxID=3051825 RepID=A0ABT8L8D7_9BACT|nr:sulfite exporter TauE/SafE family protein [Fulvivirgaceae bacterium BMA12]
MEGLLTYWYLLPISIIIATIAMSSGIGGAVFFSPLFLLLLALEPAVAIGAALITEFFGFSSGVYAYSKARLIDYKLGINLLLFSIPPAIIGSLVADYFDPDILKTIFASGIIFIGWQLFAAYRQEEKEKNDQSIKMEFQENFESSLTDRGGNVYRYTVCNKPMGRFFALVGGFFLGMISVGLAELQEYHLVGRCRVPSRVAVATSVFVVVITVLVASVGHITHFVTQADPSKLQTVFKVVIFTVPGVVLGGQLGPLLQKRINPDVMKISISVLFVLIGLFLLGTLIF